MIDTHCHILPVDDGSKSIEESIEMAKIAQNDGIKKIINTSHYNPDFDYIHGEQLKEKLNTLNNTLKQNNINIEILLGNELYYNDTLLKNIDKTINKDFYTLANSSYILIEFSPINFPKNILDIIYEFKIRGYKLIIAHIERYKETQENPSLVKQIINEGAYIQVNSSSVLKKGPTKSNELCHTLLKNNLVHIIASDAHGSNKRKPLLKESYEHIEKTYGQENAKTLFTNNPQNIINNEKLINMVTIEKNTSNLSFLYKILNKIKGNKTKYHT